MLVPCVSAVEYKNSRTYNGQFTDISESDWFYSNVVDAYSLGIINGKSETVFAPEKTLTIAETIKIAAVCHLLLSTGEIDERAFTSADPKWYAGYLAYSFKNGIVTEEYEDYNAPALRCQVAVLFARAITSSGVTMKNLNNADFGKLPDVPSTAWYAGAVYKMYNWGIMTGSTSEKINPTTSIKRSEISAVIMRMIDPDERITVGDDNDDTSDDGGIVDTPPVVSSPKITLYSGDHVSKTFVGITAFGGSFKVADSAASINESYSIDLADDIILEKNNISFKLYKGEGYEALGIVRGWMNEAACGVNGQYICTPDKVIEKANDLLRIRIDGKQYKVTEIWYADHGDYTTYAFYFSESLSTTNVKSVEFVCGKITSDKLRSNGKSLLAALLDETEDTTDITLGGEEKSDYELELSNAKDDAYDIIFEHETERCTILYGRGLYGRDLNEYRLIFVFRDGSTQTVSTEKLDEIRMSQNGDVLYYTLTAPDEKSIQYGVNFN